MLCILSNSSEVPITTLDILLQFPSPANFLLFSLTLLIALYFLLAFPKLSPANPNLNFPKVTWLPFPVPLVLQGYLTLHHLQCSGIHLFSHLTSLYGPTFHLPFGPLPVLCTADPLIISKLLSSPNPSHLQKSGYIYKRLFVEQLHEGLFVSQYFTWFPHRKCLSRAFTYNSLLTYIPIINQRAQELTTEITRTFPNFHQLLGVNLLHLVSDLMVGFQAHSAENIENLHKSIETHKECLLHVFRYPYLFLHPFWKFSGKKPASDRATLQMRTAMKQVAKYKLNFNLKPVLIHRFFPFHQIISSSRFLSQSNPGAPGDLKFKPLLALMRENQWTEKEILDNFASLIFAVCMTLSKTTRLQNPRKKYKNSLKLVLSLSVNFTGARSNVRCSPILFTTSSLTSSGSRALFFRNRYHFRHSTKTPAA